MLANIQKQIAILKYNSHDWTSPLGLAAKLESALVSCEAAECLEHGDAILKYVLPNFPGTDLLNTKYLGFGSNSVVDVICYRVCHCSTYHDTDAEKYIKILELYTKYGGIITSEWWDLLNEAMSRNSNS